jgi:hypothetical protein
MDQQYDVTKIIPENGDFHAFTIAEAECSDSRRKLVKAAKTASVSAGRNIPFC